MIDRNKEVAHILEIGQFTVYATFANGIILTFREGRPITTAEMADPLISDKVAERVALLHKVTLGQPGHENEMLQKTLTLLSKINPNTDLFDKSILEEKVKWVQEYLAKELADVPFALCHCDLFEGNLIWDEEAQEMNFIDWEYCGWTWPHYDIADHFFEYGGLDLNASSYPTIAQQRRFLRVYLRTLYGTEPDDALIDKWQKGVDAAVKLSVVYFGIWGYFQAQNSIADFPYLDYGVARLGLLEHPLPLPDGDPLKKGPLIQI
jgi:ethanolamine kinase